MGFISNQTLIENYLKRFKLYLEKDEKKAPSSLLKTTYILLLIEFIYLGLILLVIFVLPIYYYFFKYDNIGPNLGNLIFVIFIGILYVLFCIIFKYFIKIPKLHDIISLWDPVKIIREKVNGMPISYNEIELMFKSINNLEESSREILLNRYYEMIDPIIQDSNNYGISSPFQRLLCYQIINDISNIKISSNESRILYASLLRIGQGELKNHLTRQNQIFELLRTEDKSSFKHQIKKTTIEDLENLRKILNIAVNKVSNIENILKDIYQKE